MKVIFINDLKKQGKKGDIKEVKDGYASFLIKNGYVVPANDGNLIYVTITRFELVNTYDDIYPTLNGKKGILYLDSGNHFEIKG